MRLPLPVFLVVVLLTLTEAWGDVRDTKHNLAGVASREGEVGGAAASDSTQEVCVFCHTPGVSELSAGSGPAPVARWQRSVEAAFTFELFDDIGKLGTEGGGAVGSVSMACLSCHDSAQAFGVVPGSASDHPFGVPYRGAVTKKGQGPSSSLSGSLADSGLPANSGKYLGEDSEFRPVRSGTVNRREVWWAAMADTGRRTKSDLPLYPRQVDQGLTYGQVPFIECTSCHDPHSSREVFLRTSNEESKLCMTCHIK